MSSPTASRKSSSGLDRHRSASDAIPPTVAAFSPVGLSQTTPSASRSRSTILVHQSSPLLYATPPQITRALAYSHPFLLPLNKFLGLLTWSTGDPWESFILLATFWAFVLYGDYLMRFAGPVVIVAGLILGMYSRRYSPLSSTGWVADKQNKAHKRAESELTNLKSQKTLDEILDTLKVFTSRCNVLLDPLLHLTDFLSTQRTATTATTRPALTTMFMRILLVTPAWIILSLTPFHLITTKRVALFTGTIFFTWHSRPAQVTRAILWRSSLVRNISATITGLEFAGVHSAQKFTTPPPLPPRRKSGTQEDTQLASTNTAKRRAPGAGVRFTFIVYENQRRWVGLGWTTSLFGYERAPWTDEHDNPSTPKDSFELPEVEGGIAKWRWVKDSRWLVDGAGESDEGGINAKGDATDGGQGWIYYDNKWQGGRRGVDRWGSYTRRRKWYRDAELIEVSSSTEITPARTPTQKPQVDGLIDVETHDLPPKYKRHEDDTSSIASAKSGGSSTKSSGLRPGALKRSNTIGKSSVDLVDSVYELEGTSRRDGGADWGLGDDARMTLE